MLFSSLPIMDNQKLICCPFAVVIFWSGRQWWIGPLPTGTKVVALSSIYSYDILGIQESCNEFLNPSYELSSIHVNLPSRWESKNRTIFWIWIRPVWVCVRILFTREETREDHFFFIFHNLLCFGEGWGVWKEG